jgi:hypothetical protein
MKAVEQLAPDVGTRKACGALDVSRCACQKLRPTILLADMKHVSPANEMKRVTEKTRDLLSSVDFAGPARTDSDTSSRQAEVPRSRST